MQSKPVTDFMFAELAAVAALIFSVIGYNEVAGTFSHHMIAHIVLMTVMSPLLACTIGKCCMPVFRRAGLKSLPAAAALQAVLFFAWHSPPGLAAGQTGVPVSAMLLFSSLWFWLAIFDQAGARLWEKVAVLLLTGKLFCLYAVLLTFAPRVLYGEAAFGSAAGIDLADQQLAGLLMITACPLTYLLAATVLIYRWFWELCESQKETAPPVMASENRS
ncbi:cytochrome c oxidase assembly protein [Methylomicrobium sp. RS1]|jgi:putative membrane protein|uniref:cytochrome c oxidase assembly protein n=1 Tax=Candidatus Methylomicrobium oryzae TaxID=2802053 RepID=UPI001924EFF8|nr:cytochrome c oxidase assembly protein [Methylomicrobium sp. RS1]MBL1263062.1 cytochrome c oxidase assembly protein [Methylomicrobium sp. RS1]